MNPVRFWLSLLALLAFVFVAPAWMYFTTELGSQLPPVTRFLLTFTLPAALVLTIGSWMEPRGSS